MCVSAAAQSVVQLTVADLVRLMSFQVLLFTATMPETLQETVAKWQRKPVKILVAPGDMSISESITQVESFLFRHHCKASIVATCKHGVMKLVILGSMCTVLHPSF